jgi:hypothetical protein
LFSVARDRQLELGADRVEATRRRRLCANFISWPLRR